MKLSTAAFLMGRGRKADALKTVQSLCMRYEICRYMDLRIESVNKLYFGKLWVWTRYNLETVCELFCSVAVQRLWNFCTGEVVCISVCASVCDGCFSSRE